MLRAYYARVAPRSVHDIPREKLSSYRLGRLERIKPSGQRALSFGAELLLIESLKTLGEPELPLDIYTGPGGKPGLREGPCFSLSHSGELVFCALSDVQVGCDVQKLPEAEPSPRLLERCLCERERRLYSESENKRELFTVLWGLKESYAKMDGAGLGPLPPAEIRIQLCRPGAAAVEGSSAKLWYRVDGDYVFAVCSEKHEIPQEFGQLDIYLK